jgi:IclR family transcriptional regulator, pca regulon regulatory protein
MSEKRKQATPRSSIRAGNLDQNQIVKIKKNDDNSKNMVNSVVKAFSVLRAFSSERPAMTISEVAALTDMDRGTVFRLFHTLHSLGYLEKAETRRFRLGLKCLELGFTVLSSQDIGFHAAPLLQGCVPSLVDAASLGVLDGSDVVYLQRFDTGLRRQNIDRRPGGRVPVYGAALGHVLLAWLSEEKQLDILKRTERIKLSAHTLTGLNELLDRLRLVRANGYAISDGENAYGLRTVAVPVFSITNGVVAGISLTANSERMSIRDLVIKGLPRAQYIANELSNIIRQSAGVVPAEEKK